MGKKTPTNIQRNIGLLGTIGDASEKSETEKSKHRVERISLQPHKTRWKLTKHNAQRGLSESSHTVLTPSAVLPCGQSSPFINMLCTLQVVTLRIARLHWSIARFFPLKINSSDFLLKKKPRPGKLMNLGYKKICSFCPLTILSAACCSIPPRSPTVKKQKASPGSGGQLPRRPQPAWILSILPSQVFIWVSSTPLLFFCEPKIWHCNYLWKRALKLACMSQQKHMSGENGQMHCSISLLSFHNQTTLKRQDLHFSNYLMTHLHVSMHCRKHAVIFPVCHRGVSKQHFLQLSGAKQWHSEHSAF